MRLKPAILQLERQMLLFPVAVVLLACLSFLFGGHVFTMYDDLRMRRLSWFRLGAYTFWMTNLKASGIFAAGLMWILFAIAFLREGQMQNLPAIGDAESLRVKSGRVLPFPTR